MRRFLSLGPATQRTTRHATKRGTKHETKGAPTTNTKRAAVLCAAGFFDHYDTALYSFLAPLMAPVFFPSADPFVQLLLSYSVFATGIVFRPLGVWCAFYLAHHNPHRPLALAMSLLGLAMLGMAFLPGAHTLGYLAPLGLFLLRGLLDFAAALERSVIKFTLITPLTATNALRWSSVFEIASLGGLFAASLAPLCLATLFDPAHLAWAWRLFFALGGVCALALTLVRHVVLCADKTPFQPTKPPAARALLGLLWRYKRTLVRLACVHSFSYGTYSFAFILLGLLAPLVCRTTQPLFFISTPVFWLFDVACLLFVARFCTHLAPARLMRGACWVMALTLLPLFALWHLETQFVAIGLRLWIIAAGVVFAAPLVLWEKAITPNNPQRFLITGIGKTLGNSLLGRNLVAITLFCTNLWPYPTTPAFILTALAVLALLALQDKTPTHTTLP